SSRGSPPPPSSPPSLTPPPRRPPGPPPPLRPAARVPAEQFQLPVERMRAGYYSDKYFVRTRDVLAASGRNPRVVMQVFQKQDAWLAASTRRSRCSGCV